MKSAIQVRFEKKNVGKHAHSCLHGRRFPSPSAGRPILESTAVVVFDEFHERSVDSDLALALVRQVRNELRPDLKIVVMSATSGRRTNAKYLGKLPHRSNVRAGCFLWESNICSLIQTNRSTG